MGLSRHELVQIRPMCIIGLLKFPTRNPCTEKITIIELDWRRKKRDFLHRFNKPRLDLVIWALLSRSIPQAIDKMESIQDLNHRKAVDGWQKKSLSNNRRRIRAWKKSKNVLKNTILIPLCWIMGVKFSFWIDFYYVNTTFTAIKNFKLLVVFSVSFVVNELIRSRSNPNWFFARNSNLTLKLLLMLMKIQAKCGTKIPPLNPKVVKNRLTKTNSSKWTRVWQRHVMFQTLWLKWIA